MKGFSVLFFTLGLFYSSVSQDPGGTVVIGSLSGRRGGNLNSGGQITGSSAILGDVDAGSRLSEPPKRSNGDKTAMVLENSPGIVGGNLIPPPDVFMEPNPSDFNPPYFVSNKNSPSANSGTNSLSQSMTSGTKTITSQTSSTRTSSSFTSSTNTMNRNTMRFNQAENTNQIGGFVNSPGDVQINPLNTNSPSFPPVAAQRQVTRQRSETTKTNPIVSGGSVNNPNAQGSTRSSQKPNMAVQIGQNTATFNMGTDGKVLHKFLPTNLFENINSVSKAPINTASAQGMGGMRNPGPSISIRNIFGTNNIEGSSVQLSGSSGVLVSNPSIKGNPTGMPTFVPTGVNPTVREPNALDPFRSIRNQIVPDNKRNEVKRGSSMISAPIIDNPTNSELNSLFQNGFLSEALGTRDNQNNRLTNTMNGVSNGNQFVQKTVNQCGFFPYRDRITNLVDRRYFRRMVNGEMTTSKCADGTGFNETTCQCSDHLLGDTQCSPEVRLNFNKGQIENLTPIEQHIEADGVDASKGYAQFNGSTQMKFEYFNGYDVQTEIVIKFKYKADYLVANQSHPIVSNCVPGYDNIDPSVGVFLTGTYPHKIVFIVQTDKSKVLRFLQFDVKPAGWHDITYKYDGSSLTGIVDTKEKSLLTEGRIENRPAGLAFGRCGNRGIFRGKIDDIQIFTCIPPSLRNKG